MITHSFGIVNYLVLFGYLLAMMLVGVYFSRRQKTADDYFRGGGRVLVGRLGSVYLLLR